MEQVRIRRQPYYTVIPVALFTASLLLLAWAIIHLNIPNSARSAWPWKLQLLDIQSATTAATITGGLIFARAQYATAVRPMISWMGNVVESDELSDKYIWLVRLVNGSTAPAVIHSLQYQVHLRVDTQAGEVETSPAWVSYGEAVAQIDNAGLKSGTDYFLPPSGQSFPLSVSSSYHLILGLFTQKSMRIIDDVLIKINATDQSGDTYQRIVYCMRGADRNPRGKSIPFDT